MSERTSERTEQTWYVDLIAIWVFAFGLWPLADPGHNADSLLSILDVVLHVAAVLLLVSRWKVVRR